MLDNLKAFKLDYSYENKETNIILNVPISVGEPSAGQLEPYLPKYPTSIRSVPMLSEGDRCYYFCFFAQERVRYFLTMKLEKPIQLVVTKKYKYEVTKKQYYK